MTSELVPALTGLYGEYRITRYQLMMIHAPFPQDLIRHQFRERAIQLGVPDMVLETQEELNGDVIIRWYPPRRLNKPPEQEQIDV